MVCFLFKNENWIQTVCLVQTVTLKSSQPQIKCESEPFGDMAAEFLVASHLATMVYRLCSSLVVLILTLNQPHFIYYVIKPTLRSVMIWLLSAE